MPLFSRHVSYTVRAHVSPLSQQLLATVLGMFWTKFKQTKLKPVPTFLRLATDAAKWAGLQPLAFSDHW